jgi:DNA-binding MarR family transcriptional regulator
VQPVFPARVVHICHGMAATREFTRLHSNMGLISPFWLGLVHLREPSIGRRCCGWVSTLTDVNHRPQAKSGNKPRTVVLSKRDVEDARRLLGLLAGEADADVATRHPSSLSRDLPREKLLALKAGQILEARRQRAERFGEAIFGEPAWEMLLLLYATAGAARQTISRLAQLAPSSKATALRWIDHLVGQNLVRREPHPTDRRTAFVVLTDKGREMLETYLAEVPDLTD